ncbi:MAG: helix-turn-helix transcriptional regulator [Demequina sp.]|uniref:helix-turn-helix transcriptional regulator n=1 Tax=Demequina sp. TaxID=2050685 RepID=UPI003A8B0A09
METQYHHNLCIRGKCVYGPQLHKNRLYSAVMTQIGGGLVTTIDARADHAGLLDVHQLAEQLGVPVATLYVWRTRGQGPRGFVLGRHLRYRQDDVDAWIDAQRARDHRGGAR